MDKKKKSIIIIASILSVLLIGAVVSIVILFGKREVIASSENVYEKEYESFCTYEHAEDINIDGVLDDACWQNKKWYRNTFLANTGNNMPSFEMTSFLDEHGIYIATVAQDTNLVNNGQRDNNANSNFEYYIVGKNVDETLTNDTVNTLLINIDMTGDTNTYYSNMDRAVVVNGELNSGETKSATLELFIPWGTLGVDTSKGVPTEFYCMPGYLAVLPGQESTSVMKPVWYPYKLVSDHYVFNADGYTNADREGALVGDSKFGHAKTSNWDISQEADGIIRSATGTEYHKIFFSEEYGSNFIVETTIIPIGDLENSGPKAGIYFQSPSGIYNAVFLDMKDAYLTDESSSTRNFSKLRVAALHNNDGWNMSYFDDEMYDNPNASSKNGVKMTVIKYGPQYWVFLDGKFVTAFDYYFMDIDVIPGFFALGADVIYKDYSCEVIDESTLMEYLNNKNLYMIDAKVGSAGGEVTTSKFSVEKGGSYDITIKSNSGYEVSSVLINGEEKISDVKKKATGGTYTVTGVKGNHEIKVSFKKCEGYNFTGTVKYGDTPLASTVSLKGLTNKALYYEVAAAGEKGFTVNVPAGKYEVTVVSEGYQMIQDTVTIQKDVSKNYKASLSGFVETVKVNEKEVKSKVSAWNTEEEHLGKVTTSYRAGGKAAPLYFSKTGTDFVVETTIDYTTLFKSGGEYQPDLMGGFVFNDGTNSGWILARKSGIAYTGWTRVTGLIDYDMLTYPDKKTAKFAIAKVGEDVSVYLDGKMVETLKWSEIAPKIDAKSQVAIGLYMVADKEADIQFSNYSLKTGTSAAKNYIAQHVIADAPIAGSNLFAQSVTVNGTQVYSALSSWNLSEISNNIIMGSYAMGSRAKPLYFNAHGSTMLVETTIEYTTQFQSGVEYQPDLMGGFVLTDGTNSGWVVANKTGVTFTGWNRDRELVDNNVLTYDASSDEAPRSVKMTMAIQGKYIYVYFDDECIWKQKVSVVVPNAKSGADLAVGLYMIADKTADIKFSNTSITTDAASVNSYIDTHK